MSTLSQFFSQPTVATNGGVRQVVRGTSSNFGRFTQTWTATINPILLDKNKATVKLSESYSSLNNAVPDNFLVTATLLDESTIQFFVQDKDGTNTIDWEITEYY